MEDQSDVLVYVGRAERWKRGLLLKRFRMANYLVTGAAGFIGSCVSETLAREGHSVIGLDNLNAAYDFE
jgi:hypothetical protein